MFGLKCLISRRKSLSRRFLRTEIQNGLLVARGTDTSPYIYLAEESSEPALVSIGFAADSVAALQEIADIDGVSIETNPLIGGGFIARLQDPNGFAIEVVADYLPTSELPIVDRSINTGAVKQRIGERVSPGVLDCFIILAMWRTVV